MRPRTTIGLLLFLLASPLALGQPSGRPPQRPDAPPSDAAPSDAKGDARDEKKKDKDKPPIMPEDPVVTEHTVTIGGNPITYTATAGLIPLLDDKGKARANVFYVSYVRKDSADDPNRPVTFAFNGGPGSSSVWLHLGTLGPRRILMGPEGETPIPPGGLADNAESWLDFTDLVFVDPVSTGFSRAEEGTNSKEFHGLDEDIDAMGDFIRMFITRNRRWTSPKFLVGESYGTTRASGLSIDLHERLGIDLNGIVLVSPVLNFQTISFDLGNDDAYRLFLPTYAATAFFHGKLQGPQGASLDAAVQAARAFADSEYMLALAKGDALTDDERAGVARRMAELIGISEKFILQSNLRISQSAFSKELLRDQSRTVGRFDSRYKGIDRVDTGTRPEYDASDAAVEGPFTAGLNQYIRAELGYETDREYAILTGSVNPWNYGRNTNRYVNVAENLRQAMTQNPNLNVLVCSGYYDLATPFHAATFTVNHLGLDETLEGNISQQYYKAGHMMYLRDEDRAKLRSDAQAFYTGALAP